MNPSQGVYTLKGVVQHYAWGGYHYLPELLGQPNPDRRPFAEYWLGAHPNHPSIVEAPASEPLTRFIAADPLAVLGKDVARQFGALPYLLKVLDVRGMLSIQVHPDKAAAEKSFAAENEKGIPANAPHRNYKDGNHKPELMAALGDFWLLHGFKNEVLMRQTLSSIPEFSFLLPVFDDGGYRALYEEVMEMEQSRVNAILESLMTRVWPRYEDGALRESEADFWAARAAFNFYKDGDYDRGIFSIYFFNLVHLKKGEGIFQPAGLPHAYLEGQNIEVMANSDNVLRAGLTDKHMDVPELMKHVRFEATDPQVIRPAFTEHQAAYATPAREFELRTFELKEGEQARIEAHTAEIWLCIEGALSATIEGKPREWKKGEALLLLPRTVVRLDADAGVTLFGVTVPGAEKS